MFSELISRFFLAHCFSSSSLISRNVLTHCLSSNSLISRNVLTHCLSSNSLISRNVLTYCLSSNSQISRYALSHCLSSNYLIFRNVLTHCRCTVTLYPEMFWIKLFWLTNTALRYTFTCSFNWPWKKSWKSVEHMSAGLCRGIRRQNLALHREAKRWYKGGLAYIGSETIPINMHCVGSESFSAGSE